MELRETPFPSIAMVAIIDIAMPARVLIAILISKAASLMLCVAY
jgi:hypothetical protein